MDAAIAFVVMLAGLGQTAPTAPPSDSPPRLEPPAVLSAIPADASSAVIIRNLSQFDEAFGALLERIGFISIRPVTAAKGWSLLIDGVDDGGSLAVCTIPGRQSGAGSNSIVLIVPTTDRDALLSLVGPEPAENGLTKVKLRTRDTFVGTKGRFTVFGSDASAVKTVVESKRSLRSHATPRQLRRFRTGDATAWFNVGALSSGPALKGLSTWMSSRFGIGGVALSRATSVQMTLRFEKTGIAVQLAREFDPDSATGPTARESSKPLLLGLLDEPFALAFGMTEHSAGGRAIGMADAWLSMMRSMGVISDEGADRLRRPIRRLAAHGGDVSFSVVALPEGTDGIVAATKIVALRGDSETLSSDIQAWIAALKTGVFVDPRLELAVQRVEYRRAAENSGGVSIDHVSVDLSEFKAVDDAAIRQVVGKEGLLVRLGVVDGKHLVACLGGGLARFDAVVAAVRARRSPLASSAAIRKAGERFNKRSIEAYFALDVASQLVSRISSVLGAPAPVLSVDGPFAPVAIILRTDGEGSDLIDAFFPIGVVGSIKDALAAQAARKIGVGR
ncbi:MAG: hypothetical protein IID36_05050 [Planctomycetes bacterium]|nr:hypothetical protein [Planctomycetota bacterium]